MNTVKLVYIEDCRDDSIKEMVKMLLPKLLAMEKEVMIESLEKLNTYLWKALEKLENRSFKYAPEMFLTEDTNDIKYVFDDALFD